MSFLGLVVLGGVEGELADEFAGFGVDGGDLKVLDQEQDGGAVPGASESDVVQAAAVSQGDGAFVDLVGADAVVVRSAGSLEGLATGRAA